MNGKPIDGTVVSGGGHRSRPRAAGTIAVRRIAADSGAYGRTITIDVGSRDHAGHHASTAFYPHMHVRGKFAAYTVVYPDGRTRQLLEVPRHRFDWQERYVLAEPLKIPKGSLLNLPRGVRQFGVEPAESEPGERSVLVRAELGRDEPRLDRAHAGQAGPFEGAEHDCEPAAVA